MRKKLHQHGLVGVELYHAHAGHRRRSHKTQRYAMGCSDFLTAHPGYRCRPIASGQCSERTSDSIVPSSSGFHAGDGRAHYRRIVVHESERNEEITILLLFTYMSHCCRCFHRIITSTMARFPAPLAANTADAILRHYAAVVIVPIRIATAHCTSWKRYVPG